jgi:hypothetical protein
MIRNAEVETEAETENHVRILTLDAFQTREIAGVVCVVQILPKISWDPHHLPDPPHHQLLDTV